MRFYEQYEWLPEGQITPLKPGPCYKTEVFTARCLVNGNDCIVKHHIIDPEEGDARRGLGGVNSYVNQLLGEVKALEKCRSNPYVVQLIDYEFCLDGCPEIFIILEKASGITLKDYLLAHGSMTRVQFTAFMKHFIEAIGSIHKNGIIHRDLSYTNIFVTEELGRLQIIDFGLAYQTNFGIRHRYALTPFFAPPESVNQVLKRVGPVFDMYSVGVIMYFILSGQFPYPMERMKTPDEEAYFTPLTREDIPLSIRDFIRRCLRYASADRPKSIVEIKSEIYRMSKEER